MLNIFKPHLSENGRPPAEEKSRVMFTNAAPMTQFNPCGICKNGDERTTFHTFEKCCHGIYLCANPCGEQIQYCPAGCPSKKRRETFVIQKL